MVILLRGSMVVVVGALLLALPVMSGALPALFYNGSTLYKLDCSASNPSGAPACRNVPYVTDISYKFGEAPYDSKVFTDADINVNRGVWIRVPNNYSVLYKNMDGNLTAPVNAIVCYNIPVLQRDDVNQPMTNANKYVTETSAARDDLQFCVEAVVQDCPFDSTAGKNVCPAAPYQKLP
jgi:hypothetical protein